ncbi:MAG: LysR family transcriptional regulator [Labilithrix sp.]|nr:LysR family transcriptional regulator [Labilithrix sp.]MCW5812686.1 LysR family transcriptional regulator [Labilithrix sp.]
MDPALLPPLVGFAHVAAHRSFTKAAAKLGVSRAALSQSLKALEKKLGVQLLYRTTRSMSLTEAGQRLFDQLQPALQSLDHAVRELGQATTEPTGLVRINTARMAARELLEPHLTEFLARHPKLTVELVMDDGISNIIADGCDAGIRIGERLAEHVVAVPITPMLEMAVVATPAYFARHGRPSKPTDLAQHNCIAYRRNSGGSVFAWEFTDVRTKRELTVEPRGNLITNDDEGMLRAALQGLGLIQHIDFVVRRHLDEGRLERVLKPWCAPFPGFYLYVPSREMPSKVRALRDFLVEKRGGLTSKAAAPRRARNASTRATKTARIEQKRHPR